MVPPVRNCREIGLFFLDLRANRVLLGACSVLARTRGGIGGRELDPGALVLILERMCRNARRRLVYCLVLLSSLARCKMCSHAIDITPYLFCQTAHVLLPEYVIVLVKH